MCLAHNHVVHFFFAFCLGVFHCFGHHVAAFGAHPCLCGIVHTLWNTCWGAVIIHANTDAFLRLCVKYVVLMVLATAALWLAKGTFGLRASSSVGLGIYHCKMLVAAVVGARGA